MTREIQSFILLCSTLTAVSICVYAADSPVTHEQSDSSDDSESSMSDSEGHSDGYQLMSDAEGISPLEPRERTYALPTEEELASQHLLQRDGRWNIILEEIDQNNQTSPQHIARAYLEDMSLRYPRPRYTRHTRSYDDNAIMPNFSVYKLVAAMTHCPICIATRLQSGTPDQPGNHHRLACGHAICTDCWPAFSNTHAWVYSYAPHRYKYQCPMCRTFSPVSNYYPLVLAQPNTRT